MNRDLVLLRHMLDAIQAIRDFTRDGREAFFTDRKTRSAVLRELQTLAESSQRLSEAAKARRPEIFWPGIAGFRNVLVHDYLGIDHERVWTVVEVELPRLREAVEALLEEEQDRQ